MKNISLPFSLLMAVVVVGDSRAATIAVPPGGDLQQALNAARPGDTVMLEPNATYVGNFVLPAGPGEDDGRVITVRTSGDAGLPREGERIGPAAADLLAKVRSPNNLPALKTAPGARGWQISLLEFQANRDGGGDIIALGDGSSAQRSIPQVPTRITLDRLYVHGDPQRGQKRGIALNSSNTVITGCHVSDIKSIGQDSQAIAGWNGPGGYVIENNYLEAAGENILFGGADPAILALTPTNITIRGNTLTKPIAWRDRASGAWQVKNLLELKNARTVIIERNVLERSWQQAQSGYAILFTVRNQDGGCPWCQVENVRFRFNVVRDVAAGINILGVDNNFPSRQTTGIVISDNLFDGIDRAAWGGDGYFLQLSGAPQDITIDHNTIVQGSSGGLVKIAQGVTGAFSFTNNLAGHGEYGFAGKDRGVGMDSIRAYLPGARVTNNVMAGGNGALYPPGNYFPSVEEFRRQFMDARARDFRLVAAAPWTTAGTDGRALGADIVKLPLAFAPIVTLPNEPEPPRAPDVVPFGGRPPQH